MYIKIYWKRGGGEESSKGEERYKNEESSTKVLSYERCVLLGECLYNELYGLFSHYMISVNVIELSKALSFCD